MSGKVSLPAAFDCHFESSGHGDIPIVFVPGWTMSSAVFERQLAHFGASQEYRCYSYDPRGQGRSSKPEHGHTYLQHGRDLHAFLAALDLHDVVLAGWSFGVLDVLSYVAQYGPDNLKALIIIDGTPITAGHDTASEWIWVGDDNWFACNRDFSLSMMTDRRDEVISEFSAWMLENPKPEDVSWVASISRQTPGWVASLTNASATAERFDDALAGLDGKLPLLFVMATDHWIPAAANWVGANTPSARIVKMGHHLLFWERSQQFNAALDEFLIGLNG
jgi:pimeloyl-ACP methyl ester carboxylesterase